jgi:hypothetical protein
MPERTITMKDFVIFGDILLFAAGFATCYFSAKIKVWLAGEATQAETAAKSETAEVAADIKSKL